MVETMKRAAAVLVLGLLASSPAFAFRCGSKLVVEGDTRGEVLAKCGEPTDVISLRSVFRRPMIWTNGRPYYIGTDYMEVPVEAWVYNLGPNKLMRRLRFEDGVVAEIETLGHGYN
jgi:hypothetical protein